MNVLVCAHKFFPLAGGAQVYAALLANGMVREGCSVKLVTETREGEEEDSRYCFEVVRKPRLLGLWRLIGDADIVQLTGPILLPLMIAVWRRKPVVIEHHGYQAICPNGLLFYEPTKTICPGHFMARRYHKCLRCAANGQGWGLGVRFVLSTFLRRGLCHLATVNAPITHHVESRLRLPRSKVIYYGVPDPAVLSMPLAPFPSVPPWLAYVGRLVSEKGLLLLVEAVRRLIDQGRDVRLRMVGEGPERGRLEATVKANGLEERVVFTGHLHGTALQDATRGVTAIVMPSIWEETAGLAAMEHMMRGGAVVAADVGGLGEIVDGTALKFPCGDVDGLLACLCRLLDEPDLGRKLGQRARVRATELFAEKRMIREHLDLYARLLRE